ncbi:hypothetical protein [Rhodoferax sp.]|uniref:hypothetical protein n=1 Tax=Rhodoferax sp. TaxID=50421 RepID=UPI003C738505
MRLVWYEDRALGLSSFNPLIGILMKTIGLKSLRVGCHCEPAEGFAMTTFFRINLSLP